jgi:hypothetical protein
MDWQFPSFILLNIEIQTLFPGGNKEETIRGSSSGVWHKNCGLYYKPYDLEKFRCIINSSIGFE